MTRWEYMTITHAVSDAELNKNGDAGWELVAVTTSDSMGRGTQVRHYFKRPLPQQVAIHR